MTNSQRIQKAINREVRLGGGELCIAALRVCLAVENLTQHVSTTVLSSLQNEEELDSWTIEGERLEKCVIDAQTELMKVLT